MLETQGRIGWEGLILRESGSGPTLLCLHGLGGCGEWFQGLAVRLRSRYRVLFLDLPGTGVNRVGGAPFSIDGCADLLAEYLLRRETEAVALLGHSLGTILGLRLAAILPERVGSLLCVGGLPEITSATRQRLAERRELILEKGMGGLGWKAAEGNFSRASLEGCPETAALFARLWESQSPAAYVEALDALAAEAGRPALNAKLPCLVLRGSEDTYAPAAESRRFASSLPGPVSFVELEQCGHLPFLESPAAFAAAVTDFLDAYVSLPA
jgi:pimeloyl-ACP methyl ester carboxylesterase